MSPETDKDNKTPPAPDQISAPKAQPAAAEAPKAPQASTKPSAPVQRQAGSPARPEPAAPAFSRRRVWPD